MLRQYGAPSDLETATAAPCAPVASALRSIVDAWRQGLAAYRRYYRLTSKGTPHDAALRLALGMIEPLASDMRGARLPVTTRPRSGNSTSHCRHGHGDRVAPSRVRDAVKLALLIYGG
jgi:hypothetical protein